MPHLGYDRIVLESMNRDHADVAQSVLHFAPDITRQAFEVDCPPCKSFFESLDFALQACNLSVPSLKTANKTLVNNGSPLRVGF